MSDTAPVQIGQTVYEALAWSYGDNRVPCPVCYGKLFAVLELGNGERVTVECDGCGLGYEGPQGTVNEPCAGSRIDSFVVAGFVREGDTWLVMDSSRHSRKWGDEAFATREAADYRRTVLYAEAVQDAERRTFMQRAHKRKSLTWKVRYHRDCIKRAERDLAYHTRQLSDDLARQRQKAAPTLRSSLTDTPEPRAA